MKLYRAVDALDNADSLFLVYPDGQVAIMLPVDISTVRANQELYRKNRPSRFLDAIDPVLIEEW